MKALTLSGCSRRHSWIKVWLASAAICLWANHGYAQAAAAPPAPPSAASSSSYASIEQFATQLAQGLNLITACGFVAGCVMVVNGCLNARRDENWKMTVIHGLGVAGSVALCKTLFGLFVANRAGFINSF
jgi:hypothetical protein